MITSKFTGQLQGNTGIVLGTKNWGSWVGKQKTGIFHFSQQWPAMCGQYLPTGSSIQVGLTASDTIHYSAGRQRAFIAQEAG